MLGRQRSGARGPSETTARGPPSSSLCWLIPRWASAISRRRSPPAMTWSPRPTARCPRAPGRSPRCAHAWMPPPGNDPPPSGRWRRRSVTFPLPVRRCFEPPFSSISCGARIRWATGRRPGWRRGGRSGLAGLDVVLPAGNVALLERFGVTAPTTDTRSAGISATLRREDRCWEVACGDRLGRLSVSDTKGLRYLAEPLRRPGTELNNTRFIWSTGCGALRPANRAPIGVTWRRRRAGRRSCPDRLPPPDRGLPSKRAPRSTPSPSKSSWTSW